MTIKKKGKAKMLEENCRGCMVTFIQVPIGNDRVISMSLCHISTVHTQLHRQPHIALAPRFVGRTLHHNFVNYGSPQDPCFAVTRQASFQFDDNKNTSRAYSFIN